MGVNPVPTMRVFLDARKHVVIDAETGHVFEVAPDEKLGGGNSHFEHVGTIHVADIRRIVEQAKRGKQ